MVQKVDIFALFVAHLPSTTEAEILHNSWYGDLVSTKLFVVFTKTGF
jgi:hypothetical protein